MASSSLFSFVSRRTVALCLLSRMFTTSVQSFLSLGPFFFAAIFDRSFILIAFPLYFFSCSLTINLLAFTSNKDLAFILRAGGIRLCCGRYLQSLADVMVVRTYLQVASLFVCCNVDVEATVLLECARKMRNRADNEITAHL